MPRLASRLVAPVLLLSLAAACRPRGRTCALEHPELRRPSAPAVGTPLGRLAQAYWDRLMRAAPERATYLGDRRFDAELPDPSVEARRRLVVDLERLRLGVQALEPGGLSEEERVTRAVLLWSIDGARAEEACRRVLWDLDPLYGPQVWLAELSKHHAIRTSEHAATLLARYRKIPAFLERYRGALAEGLLEGYAVPTLIVDRVLGQLDRLLALPADRSPFVATVVLPASFGKDHAARFRRQLVERVEATVYPALRAHAAFLRREYRPHARSSVGVFALPGGRACYAALARQIAGTTRTPEEIHRIGLDELTRLEGEMRQIARKLAGHEDLPRFMAWLRSRPEMYAKQTSALLARADGIVTRALAALPRAFGRLPRRPVRVRPIEAFRAADAPAAFYYPAPDDGSRPGYFYLNVHDLSARPLYNLEALTYHEAVPGHHLQIALAQEQASLPLFRRHEGQTAFVEGWALYSEVLSDELGLYSSPATRFGYLNYQAWRAARLVVDTGLHALGWSRERALRFMQERTALTPREVENEIDRYINWPGQALAYLLGRLTFQELRSRATRALGPRFRLAAFHDEALRHGAVPLEILSTLIDAWIARAEGRRAPSS
ncbi:MAG: DUF885 domain-containing protein [Deltaproteobacteria bacterium]|nr:DUF885 domain-containing protein [Deltaproteobacteria bacterium]